MASEVKRWAATSRPVPPALLTEVEKRGWGREVARLTGDRPGLEDENARLGRVLARIEERYGAEGRKLAEERVEAGKRDGAAWHERNLGAKSKPFTPGPSGGFWNRKG